MGWGEQRKKFVKNFNNEAKKVEDKIEEIIEDPSLIEDGLRKLAGHIEDGAEKLGGHIKRGAKQFASHFKDKKENSQNENKFAVEKQNLAKVILEQATKTQQAFESIVNEEDEANKSELNEMVANLEDVIKSLEGCESNISASSECLEAASEAIIYTNILFEHFSFTQEQELRELRDLQLELLVARLDLHDELMDIIVRVLIPEQVCVGDCSAANEL